MLNCPRTRLGFRFDEAGNLVTDKPAYSDLRYTLGLQHRLNGDTLNTVSWQVPAGLQQNRQPSNTTNSVTVSLAGGMPGETYRVVCQYTTLQNDADQAEFLITITP